jgi:WD40 repeat protein
VKNHRFKISIICVLGIISLSSFAEDNGTLYTSDSGNVLYTLNESTGIVEKIGRMSGSTMTDLAFDGEILYGVNFSRQLVEIDPKTANTITTYNVGASSINSLAISPDGKIFSAGSGFMGALYIINPNSNTPTHVGYYGFGLASSGDLAFDPNGILYATVTKSGSSTDWLAQIDTTTGVADLIGPIGVRGLYGISFKCKVLYGVSSSGQLVEINTTTGKGTIISIPKPLPVAWGMSVYGNTDSCGICQLYGVNDKGLNNSQFFTITPETFEVKALGVTKSERDIEALDVHPNTGELFAASGENTDKAGYLYKVDRTTGKLDNIGYTGFNEIDGLSFHPDGTLWGWATGDGLVNIDIVTGQANLTIAYAGEIEDLTWNVSGTMLYGLENLVDSSSDMGVKLLAYDGTTLTTICEELTQSLGLEIEALDTLPDDTLIFGLHGKNSLPIGVIDVTNCQIVAETEVITQYSDVEGLAWPKNCVNLD